MSDKPRTKTLDMNEVPEGASTRRDAPQPAKSDADDPKSPERLATRRSGRRMLASSSSISSGPASSTEGERPPTPLPMRPLPRFPWGRVLLIGVLVLSGLFALGATGVYFTLEHVARDLPSVEKLRSGYNPPQITRILARDETLLASVFTERRTVVPFEQIPDSAKLAFLAAEDAHFYEHEGLNYLGMLRALVANIRAGKTVQGGSTITQQVIKNVLLDSERSYRRKIRETVLARRLEQSLSKDEIFWLYLNHIYLGHGRYGIEEAARYYFGKHASELALEEAATLAGLVAAPERFSPRRDADKSLQRRRYVLNQMVLKGFLTRDLFDTVDARPLRLAPAEETESRLAPEVVDQARKQLRQRFGAAAQSGGHTVYTTIDPTLQAAARQAVRDNLDAYMKRHELLAPFNAKQRKLWGEPFSGQPKVHRIYNGIVDSVDDHTGTVDVRVGDVLGRVTLASETRYNPTHLPPSKFTSSGAMLRVRLLEAPEPDSKPPLSLELGPQSVLVALDVRSRDVLALIGSYEAISGGLDRATDARRQPGSTFKPLLYSYALHSRNFSPVSMIPVEKVTSGVVETPNGPAISLREALTHSNNQASTMLLKLNGPEQVVQWAHAMGIASELKPDLSLALGSYEVAPIELASAYATLASGGMYSAPRFVGRMLAPDGTEVPPPVAPPERRVLAPEEAYLTTSLMRSVVQSGTGRAAQAVGRDVAGKTGTTNDAKDAWFAGFSTDIVAVVWVGYDDAKPLGKRESGAATALPAWVQFMKAAHAGKPKTTFRRPSGVVQVEVDARTGLLPRLGAGERRREEFLAGTEPTQIAPAEGDAGAPQSDAPSGDSKRPGESRPPTTPQPAPPPF